MRRNIFRKIAVSIALTISLAHSPLARSAIFGTDRRTEVQSGSPFFNLGQATAVAVLSTNIETSSDGRINLLTDPISERLCKDERFSDQPSLSYACSGFLVAPDLLVTAGHCQANVGEVHHETDGWCKVFSWLFDYQLDASGGVQTKNIDPALRLYHCKQILFAVVDEHAPFRDYALIQLDRPVLGRQPLRLSKNEITSANSADDLTLIGYPMGLPMKADSKGHVLFSDPKALSFITNLNAFEGNSGSAVLDKSGAVVGILIGGTPTMSTITDKAAKCERLNRCDADGKNCALPDLDPKKLPPGFQKTGSEVERITPISDLLKVFR
jgi:V8-like Glu-specific endopeptidase